MNDRELALKMADVIFESRGNKYGLYALEASEALIEAFGLRYETHAATEGNQPMKRIIGDWSWA